MENVNYKLLAEQAKGFLEEEPYYVSALSNISALIMSSVSDLNWSGFYLMKDGQLTLGPFQGNVACIHIQVGRGVCGTAVAEDATQLVTNVHEFPGHIACDSASNSEIVVPIHADGKVVAVLDIDSPLLNRFDQKDKDGFEGLVKVLENYVTWN